VVEDVVAHPLFAGTPAAEVMREAGALACQSTPLLDASGRVLGVLSTHYERPHAPSTEELQVLDVVTARASHWLSGASALTCSSCAPAA
jgi:hypothetical protein